MRSETYSRDRYHHGNLPEVLINEGSKVLAEKGVDGFSMREVARRAGVAVAAPSHHFGNAKGLLTAIAAQGFGKLATSMDLAASASRDCEDRVVAMCQAYRAMGMSDPGYAAIMFRVELVDESDQRFQEQSHRAFDLFAQALKQAASANVDAAQINYAAQTLWATMHGLVDLKMIKDQEAEELIRFAVRTLLAGIR
ncbi:TetR/AcrR family transcriptional regulator [Hoeflea poritis]|uniref:TetR-like C-terminal domain-containing protein n=1 Tax=Hoeflea poritis TaxID=2993659 RepID=A0ABT4VR39_9HYPH|nr:TetR-like C-terminal domain-containing protein [Hoeflea poritis]MDA4847173.1 TetR-like C-terminal domain-containing protein [Hoeflea poritis]